MLKNLPKIQPHFFVRLLLPDGLFSVARGLRCLLRCSRLYRCFDAFSFPLRFLFTPFSFLSTSSDFAVS